MLGIMWRKENILKYSLFLKSEILQIGLLQSYWFPNQPNNQKNKTKTTWIFLPAASFNLIFIEFCLACNMLQIFEVYSLISFEIYIHETKIIKMLNIPITFESFLVPFCNAILPLPEPPLLKTSVFCHYNLRSVF